MQQGSPEEKEEVWASPETGLRVAAMARDNKLCETIMGAHEQASWRSHSIQHWVPKFGQSPRA
ncbi:MAG: hypothetical protein J2P51_12315 [Hyphomicrobiaceae bacterium]|nr:hypothetical protein [Hyphomicrobiaceae bacterium]